MWPAVVLAAVGMVVVAVMALGGVDPSTIVLVVSLLVTPILGALIAGQVAEMKGATAQVAQQTNGNQARLLDILEAQGRMLATSAPAPTVPSGQPEASAPDQPGNVAA